MKLSPGEQIASYTVVALVGYGAMGHVYGARHKQLDRIVALKALPSELASDRAALARFRREALSASRLAHPNICTIHDFIDDPRGPFIVMEYLDGETLADRLLRQPLDEDTAANITLQLASGLAHAHGKGVVHRDLKPSNVMLTPDGAKILDFGVAKDLTRARAVAGDPAAADNDATAAGVAVGTLPYMAPEQILGGVVDARTDIYAVGVIVHQMLTGRLPYPGPATKDIVTGILTGEPAPFHGISRLRQSRLARIAKRCMAVDPDRRYQSTAELAADLRKLGALSNGAATERGGNARRRRVALFYLAFAATAVLLAYLLIPRLRSPAFANDVSLLPPNGWHFSDNQLDAVVSPDGRVVLFAGGDTGGVSRLWLQQIANREAVRTLPHVEGAHTPFWAPDNARFGYFKDSLMYQGDTAGNQPVAIARAGLESRGATWNRHDAIVFAPHQDSGLSLLVLPGRAPRPLTAVDRQAGQLGHQWPYFLRDGRHFVFYVHSNVDSVRGIYLGDVAGMTPRKLVGSVSSALVSDDHLLYYDEGHLWAHRLKRGGELDGARHLIVRNVAVNDVGLTAASVSANRTLVHSTQKLSRLESIDTAGRRTPLTDWMHLKNPALSDDGNRIAVQRHRGTQSDIIVLGVRGDRSEPLPITAPATVPAWSPDGTRLAFVSHVAQGFALMLWHLDRRAEPRQLAVFSDRFDITDWSRDGDLLLNIARKGVSYDIISVNADQRGAPRNVVADPAALEVSGVLSPSERRLAYVSNYSGQFHVYVENYPGGTGRCRVSADQSGFQPRWGSTDETIYYLELSGNVMATTLPAVGCPEGSPRHVTQLVVENLRNSSNTWAWNRATSSFIVNVPARSKSPARVDVLLNWPARIRTAPR